MVFGLGKTKQGAASSKTSLVVDAARCPQNHRCPSVGVCPVDALSQTGFSAPTVDQDACISCGKCVSFCPMRALSLV
ncbi:MAG: 4Fe-4S binding protein [Gordonibacter sp.]|nr:4Fe-4S binding protein [Gordonibacter sp.]